MLLKAYRGPPHSCAANYLRKFGTTLVAHNDDPYQLKILKTIPRQ